MHINHELLWGQKLGNLTGDETRTYSYDCENRLKDLTVPYRWYRYDYQGRRVRQYTTGSSSVNTKYVYDGDQIVCDYNDSMVLQRKYVYGPGIDEPICMIDVVHGNAVYYYHFDGLGSVAAMSDSAGNIVEKYKYDVYGKPTILSPQGALRTTSDVNNRYMFTGREYDSETGLYYYRARHYKPSIGRFLQTDPIGYKGGMNLHTYCGNNPVIFIDPFGDYPGDIHDKKSCFNYCDKRYEDHLATARWAYDAALNAAQAFLGKCLAGCDKLFPPTGPCPSDPTDRNANCKFLCNKAYGALADAAYAAYQAALAGAWSQYKACQLGCSIFW